MERLTFEDLQRRRQQALTDARQAVQKKRRAYLELKKLIHSINSGPLDVSDYYCTAVRVGSLLDEIDSGDQTIFSHFKDQIDPHRQGRAIHFRFECLDLAQQITELENWRIGQSRLRIVK